MTTWSRQVLAANHHSQGRLPHRGVAACCAGRHRSSHGKVARTSLTYLSRYMTPQARITPSMKAAHVDSFRHVFSQHCTHAHTHTHTHTHTHNTGWRVVSRGASIQGLPESQRLLTGSCHRHPPCAVSRGLAQRYDSLRSAAAPCNTRRHVVSLVPRAAAVTCTQFLKILERAPKGPEWLL
jgi:hypothetical protein